MKNQESALETGLLLLGLIIAFGMAILLGGRTMTSVQDQLRRSKKSPARGEIGEERHRHISTVAAR